MTRINFLYLHLKYVRSLTFTSMYRCGFQHCPQTFTSFHSFSKHMKSKICNTNPIQQISINNEKYSTIDNNISSEINPNVQFEDLEQNENILNVGALKYLMMQFLMRYYGKFNFSRKDALLQHDITNMIMFPIAQHVDQICKHDKQ